ncbi:MAG TPA: hypothetical protein QF624_11415 [Dehalococcoidia bacterium]|nr:hypothetical protein [Dehalococcoidia bacterium]
MDATFWEYFKGRSLAVVAGALVVGIVLGGGVAYLLRTSDLNAVEETLTTTTAELATADANVDRLAGELAVATTDARVQAGAIEELEGQLTAREGELEAAATTYAELEAASLQSVTEYQSLATQFEDLNAIFATVQEELVTLTMRWSTVAEIDSLPLATNALYFDAGSEATVLRAICTGSMEPTITCDDTLIAFPPSIQDLDVGDVIVFRAPIPGCLGFSNSATILHRIVEISRSDVGQISFRTKGDSTDTVDACLVPVGQVVFKVLAIISDSRFTN